MTDATDDMVIAVSDAVDVMADRIRELEAENNDLQNEIIELERQLKKATT